MEKDMKAEHRVESRCNGSVLFQLLIGFIVLSLGMGTVVLLMKNRPKAKPRTKPVMETVVEVERVQFSSQPTAVVAMGNIIAENEVELKPRVSGEVRRLSDQMVVGGSFSSGDVLFEIDDADYQLALLESKSEVTAKQSELALEKGSQNVAAKEFELLGESASGEEKALMLREPQLVNAKASLQSADARLKKAQLNLSRTKVRAPFNGVVLERFANKGSRVAESTILANLVSSDACWVEMFVPVDQLKFVRLPRQGQEGAVIRVYSQRENGKEQARQGHIVRLGFDLETQGRMAKVYGRVEDPFGLHENKENEQKLFIGSYVQIEIDGKDIDRAYAMSRSHLHDNDTVWVMHDGRLDIRVVEIGYRAKDHVLITGGLEEGEEIIVSAIATPVNGMTVHLAGQKRKAMQDGMSKAGVEADYPDQKNSVKKKAGEKGE